MKKIGYYMKRILNMNFTEMFKTINKIHNRSGKSRIFIFFDMIYCSYKYLAGYTDYFLFYFEDLPNETRKTYITRGVNNGYLKTLNDSAYYHFFRNKVEFNQKFEEFIGREYLDLRKTNLKKFEKFLKKHSVIMVKPIDQSGGANVSKIVIDKTTNIEKLYEVLLQTKQYLVEDYVRQHKEMNRLCKASVNTLRIVTVRKNNHTTVMLRAIRIGNGIRDVDNFHSGGMYTLFDEKGVITKPAMDREGKLFEIHPVSNVAIKGFKIPFYKEAIAMAIKASEKIPEVGLVGWDIAITDKGPILIEGNELPGYDIYQSKIHLSENREGLKPFFDRVIYGEENNKN